ncbi:MarR family transcriptional regulator [Streptomyces sp. NPDC047082]|uniref:MarR family winged helix-turn-helix transcriptional regulator n=1 Tax=Streptomyces sp. NPDC047082 TaxID=3155259 RepID=UPI003406558D
MRASELARASGQHKQVIGSLIDDLERLGHVARKPDPADRRAKLICPTERGLLQMETAAIMRHHRGATREDTGQTGIRHLQDRSPPRGRTPTQGHHNSRC